MDITLLKTFIEVYQTGHFGKAADNLFVTQSAVSARIRQLEEQLGVKLFTRERNNIQPTGAGKKLHKHVENILSTWNRVQLDIAVQDESKQVVTVVGVPSLWDIYLSEWIQRAYRNFSEIVFSCETISHDLLYRRLLEGSADIGFTYESLQHPQLVTEVSIPINLIMVSSRSGLHAQEAIENNYIYVDWGTLFSAIHSNYFTNMPAPSLRISLGGVALDIIKAQGGAAYLPKTMVESEINSKTLFLVADAPAIQREAHIVRRNGTVRDDLIKDVITRCQNQS